MVYMFKFGHTFVDTLVKNYKDVVKKKTKTEKEGSRGVY